MVHNNSGDADKVLGALTSIEDFFADAPEADITKISSSKYELVRYDDDKGGVAFKQRL